MDQSVGGYIVTWRCETGEVKEKSSTFVLPGKNGGRWFLLTREKIPHRGKFEQFSEE